MQTLFELMLADVVFACNLIFGWIFIIIINLPTSPEFSQLFAIVLSGKSLHDNNKLVGWSFLEIDILCNSKSPIMNPITKIEVVHMYEP